MEISRSQHQNPPHTPWHQWKYNKIKVVETTTDSASPKPIYFLPVQQHTKTRINPNQQLQNFKIWDQFRDMQAWGLSGQTLHCAQHTLPASPRAAGCLAAVTGALHTINPDPPKNIGMRDLAYLVVESAMIVVTKMGKMTAKITNKKLTRWSLPKFPLWSTRGPLNRTPCTTTLALQGVEPIFQEPPPVPVKNKTHTPKKQSGKQERSRGFWDSWGSWGSCVPEHRSSRLPQFTAGHNNASKRYTRWYFGG